MNRVLIIPAAGRGSRLEWPGPKALCPVGGRPMLDRLLDRYAPFVDRVVLVVAPSAEAEFRRHLADAVVPATIVVQDQPTGMLPAVLCAAAAIAGDPPDHVWITWCDQIGIRRQTIETLARELDQHADAALVCPTVRQSPPYIHLARDSSGRIVRVLHRREGDDMPESGESDAGLFGLRRDTYLRDLPTYAAASPAAGATGERNFLPFIPWLAARKPVRTFEVLDPREAIGVNTAEDLVRLESFLNERA